MKITLRKLADDLNVSTATVSLALNDADRISPKTKERVHAYAKKVGYRSNRLARNLRVSRTRVIGCILPSVVSPIVALTLKYLYIEAFKRNYQLQVIFSETDVGQEIRAVEECIDSRVDGLILQPATPTIELCGKSHPLNRKELKDFPLVLLSSPVSKYPCVKNGIASALDSCVSHVRSQGYRGVALFSQASFLNNISQEKNAFSDVTARAGFLEKQSLFFSVHTDLEHLEAKDSSGPKVQQYYDFDKVDESAYNGAPSLLAAPLPRPLAVICRNDQLAAGFLRYCREQVLRVPDDIGIIGIDDTLSHYLSVTSIRWDYPQKAAQVFDQLEAKIDRKALPPPVETGHTLIVRSSTLRQS